MLEQIKIRCYYCCAPSTQIENFRPLVRDDLIEDVLELAGGGGNGTFIYKGFDIVWRGMG